MQSTRKITAFNAFEPFLGIFNIYETDIFQHSNRRYGFRTICRAIAFSLMIFGFAISTVNLAWFCARSGDIKGNAIPVALLINAIQLALTYISFWLNSRTFNDTIENLNMAIAKRTIHPHMCISFRGKKIIFFTICDHANRLWAIVEIRQLQEVRKTIHGHLSNSTSG